MNRLHFALVLHAHQPLGNFDHVVEEAYRLSYLPFIEMLAGHPKIKLTIHYSGSLLEWIEKHHPEYFDLLRKLVANDQLELLGGGYYEPILISIPDRDKHAQLNKLSDYLEKHFGRRPKGIWLTERVWEPALPQALAAAGIAYTLTDDTHFLNAGLEPEQLFGDYITESYGAPVRVIPGQKDLRYLLPFQAVEKTVEYLSGVSEKHPNGLAAMGDDLEKFGVWPETHKHVYQSGWLEDFFTALEEQGEWLRLVRLSDYLDANPPLGRIYLPTASYQEKMEWALPEAAEAALEKARHLAEKAEDGAGTLRFLRGGLWNNFFHKYSEANLLHKRMLSVSRSFDDSDRSGEAYDALLAGQCNDAYWHGVFGGLYAPHLRHALYANLVKASRHATGPAVSITDFDLDGRPEVVFDSETLFAVLDPGDGATIPEIDYKPGAVNVVNSLRRRHENYHDKLRDYAAAGGSGGHEAASIHDRVRVKEEGLERALIYDHYERSCFRAHRFDRSKTLDDYAKLNLEEDRDLAAGAWTSAGLVCERGSLRKTFAMKEGQISCALSSTVPIVVGPPARLGLELIFNLMAPEAHDRYFQAENLRKQLRWQGEIARSTKLSLFDWYLGIAIHITVEPAASWWVVPIHTVSQSEDGFERVYQGSMILPWWDVESAFEATVNVEIASVTASGVDLPG